MYSPSMHRVFHPSHTTNIRKKGSEGYKRRLKAKYGYCNCDLYRKFIRCFAKGKTTEKMTHEQLHFHYQECEIMKEKSIAEDKILAANRLRRFFTLRQLWKPNFFDFFSPLKCVLKTETCYKEMIRYCKGK